MKKFIDRLFVALVFTDPQKTSTARQLYTILQALFILSILFSVPFIFFPDQIRWRYLVIAGVVAPMSIFLMMLTRRGKVQMAGGTLVAMLWLVVTLGAVTAGGVRAPIFVGYIDVVIIAGLVLKQRAALATALLSLLAGFALASAEAQGFLPISRVVYTPYSALLVYVFFFLAMITLQWLAAQGVSDALNSAHAELNERRRAETARQESEARFRDIFDFSPFGIGITTPADTIVEVNAGFANMLGLDPPQLLGKNLAELGIFKDPHSLAQLETDFRTSGGINNAELIIQRPNGSLRNLLFSSRRIEIGGQPHVLTISADITERKQAEADLQQRAEEMYILYQMGNALTTGEDLYHALRGLVKELKRLMTVDAFYVGIYDEKTDLLSFPLYLNLEDDLQVPPRKLAERPGLTASVIQKRQTLYLPDVYQPEVQQAYQIVTIVDMGVHSYIGIPLINAGRIVGIISVQAREPGAYTGAQVRMLETLATQVGIAVEKYSLLEQLQQELNEKKLAEQVLKRRADEMSFLYTTGLVLSSISSQDQVGEGLHTLAGELGRLVPLDTFYVGTYDQNTDIISYPCFLVDGATVQVAARKLSDQPGISGEAIFSRQTVYITDLNDPHLSAQHPFVAIGAMKVRSILAIPLLERAEVVGVISVQNIKPLAYSPDDLRLLETLAAQVAITIAKARLFGQLQQELVERKQAEAQAQKSAHQLAMLNEIGRAVTALQDLPDVLNLIRQQVGKSMPLDAFMVALFNPEQETISFPLIYEAGKTWQEPVTSVDAETRLGRVLYQGESILYLRTTEQIASLTPPPETLVGDHARISASLLYVPLNALGKIIGAISAQSYSLNAYTEAHLRLLQEMAVQVAIAIENARLFTSVEQELAERKRAEAEVRQLNDELEKRVTARTTELEQANQELQAFSYSVSHDLRAPLRSIRSYAQILTGDFGHQLDEEGKNFLGKVIKSADEMNRLIDSLLTLFRFSRGELHRKRLDLSAEAASILEKLRHAEPTRTVTCLVTPKLAANADETLLRNVLENLLGNAWKYSSKNPHAQIEFGAETHHGEMLYFVRDNGAGFDMQYASQLFEPFQRLHRADEFPGHGIGLATVQRIIQRHGGRIWAEAAVDQGATFYFTLG